MNYNYGDAYLRHPIDHGMAIFPDGSKLKTHSIYDPLPKFMHDAEMIFTDSPWNQGNLKTFYTKAEMQSEFDSFMAFADRLFNCIEEISPRVCYLEIGKQFLDIWLQRMKALYPYVTFFNSTYYHKESNLCYVVRGGLKRYSGPMMDGVDEEDIIDKVCEMEEVTCIGDLCMGRGLVACAAYRHGKRFVGTELNHKRLSVTLERLTKMGASYEIVEDCTNG